MTKFLNISTDNTLGGASTSDEIVSSQKAIKGYVDNNSVDKNLSNVSSTGKETSIGWGMPGNLYDDLTLGASGAEYTASADGYFTIDILMGTNASVSIQNDTSGLGVRDRTTNNDTRSARLFLPCAKGDKVKVNYSNTGSVTFFRFVYTKGESNV